MGQKNSKTSTGDTVPQPSGRAETNPDQQSVDGISEAPRRKRFTIPDRERELNEDLISVIGGKGGDKSKMTMADFKKQFSQMNFTEQFETCDKINNEPKSEENEKEIEEVINLLRQGATATPIDDDADSSALFECVLSDKRGIMSLILTFRRQTLHQKYNGLTLLETTVAYRRWSLFNYLVTDFNSEINTTTNGSLATLVKISTDFGWTEELLGQWFVKIKSQLSYIDYKSLRTLTEPEFQVALNQYPNVMEEIRLCDPNSNTEPIRLV